MTGFIRIMVIDSFKLEGERFGIDVDAYTGETRLQVLSPKRHPSFAIETPKWVWRIKSRLTGGLSPKAWLSEMDAWLALFETWAQFKGTPHHHELVTGTTVVRVSE